MERPTGLNPKIAAGIIILFHIVGLVGLAVPAIQPIFLKIVPFHLILMLVVLFLTHNPINEKFISFMALIYILGFAVEWVGVHKSWIFGHYAYDNTLGVKVSAIPLTIGINWFMLIYATGITMARSRIKSKWARIILGAAMLVALDLLIEPVAIMFNYWHWYSNTIPLKNYFGWFAASGLMLWLFEEFKFKNQSWVAPLFLGIQFVFFGFLNLL